MKNKPLKMISLFSGIGGLDAGLHDVGFSPLFCSELDENAAKTLRNWLSSKKIVAEFASDVTSIEPEKLMRTLGLSPGELDLLAGGPPCQAFSLIGKRRSLNDERGILLFEMARYASAFLPKVILIEQVRGLISACCLDMERGGVLRILIEKLECLGYKIKYKIVRAADYGVAQLRDRVLIIASQEKEFNFPEPSHKPSGNSRSNLDIFGSLKSPYLTVFDVIGDLPKPVLKGEKEEIPNHVDVTPSRDRERIHGVPEGDYLARQLHLPEQQRRMLNPKKDTTKFRRLAWNEPSLTLRGGEVFYHPTQDRYLTPRECMRLHGFRDDHLLFGPIRGRTGSVRDLDQHRLVANAVPPPLAKAIGSAILTQFFEINAYSPIKRRVAS